MFTATAVNAAAFNALVRVMPTRNERSLKECLSCFGIMLLAVATGNDDLQPKAETEAEGKGGCAQFYFSHMPQENGIGDIDKLFDKDAHHYWEVDEQDIFVCVFHLFNSGV